MEEKTLQQFDLKELEQYNGKDGKPAYVAVDGKVYDITESRLWKNGSHMNRHHSGQDLSNSFEAAPHNKEVLQKFNQVGIIKQQDISEQVKPPIPQFVNDLLEKYPFLKRHPHPMVVHFPMSFFITCSIFLFWYYVISPLEPLLNAIYYLHVIGTISLPFALFTGWFAWKINYLGKPIGYITGKIILSLFVLIADIVVLVVLSNNLQLLAAPQGIEVLIPILIFSYLPVVSIIGFLGGQLVY